MAHTPRGTGGSFVDPARLARRGLMLLPLVLAVGILYLNARYGNTFGYDFRGGMWKAAHAVLAGKTPYPPPHTNVLLRQLNAYIPPPLFALVAVPFTVVSWPLAIVSWSLVSLGAFLGALYLVGVRDWRLYPLAACSFPFVCTLGFGQTEGLLALGLATAWRWRDSRPGALAVGALVAAKLIVWPLVIWLLLTRRVRAARTAAASAVSLLIVSWACIGFKGLSIYLKLLAADGRAFANRTHSITALFMHMGVSQSAAEVLGVILALAGAAVLVHRFWRDDETLFLVAVGFSLLASPMLEMHYLTLLLIPLAIVRPRVDALWVFAANVFWLSPHEPASTWQIVLVLLAVGVVLARARWRQPSTRPAGDFPEMQSDSSQPGSSSPIMSGGRPLDAVTAPT
jgi:hypothetical protein